MKVTRTGDKERYPQHSEENDTNRLKDSKSNTRFEERVPTEVQARQTRQRVPGWEPSRDTNQIM